MRKKSELTSAHIVTIILLLIGFGILLIFLYNFIWDQEIDKRVCHESVVYRASLPDVLDIKGYLPLKCHTGKICITDKPSWKFWGSKGNCKEEFSGERYSTVRVSKDADKRDTQIKTFIAREMAECWEMMGEGKVQLFKREFVLEPATKRCVICSRIALDEDLKKKMREENKGIEGLGEYLMKHKVPNKKISYWRFITAGLSAEGYDYVRVNDSYSLSQKAIIFIEHDKTDAPKWLVGVLGGSFAGIGGAKIGAAVGSVVGGPVGAITVGFIGFVGGATLGGLAGSKGGAILEEELIQTEIGDGAYAAANLFMDYETNKIDELGCKSFEEIP